MTTLFGNWQAASTPLLTGIRQGQRPNTLIETLSESLLETFRANAPIASLIDPYGVYQHLMDYWAETMQDDVWMIAGEGWQALQDGKPNKDLIPSALVVARYFAAEQKAIEQLEAERDALTRQLEELEEEHGGEDGLLSEAQTEKGKLTKASVKARLAAALEGGADVAAPGEIAILKQYLGLIDQEAAAGKQVKDAAKALDAKVAARYKQLKPKDIKQLVVHDKWLANIAQQVQGELDRVSQALTSRIKQLAERYATPIPQLNAEVEALSARVDEHLKKMGFAWK